MKKLLILLMCIVLLLTYSCTSTKLEREMNSSKLAQKISDNLLSFNDDSIKLSHINVRYEIIALFDYYFWMETIKNTIQNKNINPYVMSYNNQNPKFQKFLKKQMQKKGIKEILSKYIKEYGRYRFTYNKIAKQVISENINFNDFSKFEKMRLRMIDNILSNQAIKDFITEASIFYKRNYQSQINNAYVEVKNTFGAKHPYVNNIYISGFNLVDSKISIKTKKYGSEVYRVNLFFNIKKNYTNNIKTFVKGFVELYTKSIYDVIKNNNDLKNEFIKEYGFDLNQSYEELTGKYGIYRLYQNDNDIYNLLLNHKVYDNDVLKIINSHFVKVIMNKGYNIKLNNLDPLIKDVSDYILSKKTKYEIIKDLEHIQVILDSLKYFKKYFDENYETVKDIKYLCFYSNWKTENDNNEIENHYYLNIIDISNNKNILLSELTKINSEVSMKIKLKLFRNKKHIKIHSDFADVVKGNFSLNKIEVLANSSLWKIEKIIK